MKRIIFVIIMIVTMLVGTLPVAALNASAIPISALNSTGTPISAFSYKDISGHWAEKAIVKYADPKLFSDSAGNFAPNKIINRTEFVLMLHKALGIQINYFAATNINEFYSDVKNGDSVASPLYDLRISNIIDDQNTFRPLDQLTREEMIHYTIMALKSRTGGNYALILMMPAPFADDAKIAAKYKNDVVEAVLLQLVYGRGNNMLYPKAYATRAEAMFLTDRLVNKIADLSSGIDIKPQAIVQNDSLIMKLGIKNNSAVPVTIDYSSGQRFDIQLLDTNKEILYTWSADKSFILMLSSETLNPGQALNFTETLDASVFESLRASAAYMTVYVTGTSKDFSINPNGYTIPLK